ncbi:DUF1467 family protein [Methyloligella sp. 2.7D]|uniref:DUF1467 family protein n=1 Tax=unclassified Methyloligella TaxID=2625955 RepID=UPI00157DC935|nr:DUF1467 family protein [Methyloligella sp. GL2]QKP77533.1 DUF1467 family protein [Methyloligella sp. GL2]
MTLAFGIAIYFVIWWIVLFAMLPFGVKPQGEEGEIPPGTTASAPTNPRFLPKIIATTVVATIVFGAVYFFVFSGRFSLDDIPFLPRYETVR